MPVHLARSSIILLIVLTAACSKEDRPEAPVASKGSPAAESEAPPTSRPDARVEIIPIETRDTLVFEVVLHEKGRLELIGSMGLGHGLDGIGPTPPAEPILVRIDLEESSGEDFLAAPLSALLGREAGQDFQRSHPELAERSLVSVSCRLARTRTGEPRQEETRWRGRAFFAPPEGAEARLRTVAGSPMRGTEGEVCALVRWVYGIEGEDIRMTSGSDGSFAVRIGEGPPLEGRDLADRVLQVGLRWTPAD